VGTPIGVDYYPNDIAISPDGSVAYVTSGSPLDAGAISVINVATRQTVGQSIKLEHRPAGIAVTPDGKTAFVTSYEAGEVLVIDLQGRQLVGQISVGAWPLAIAATPDGKRVYVANTESDSISVIDTASRQAVGLPIGVGSVPVALAISPDGHFVYVANKWGGSISVIDTQSNQVVDDIPVDEPAGITFSPNGSKAYVTSGFPGAVSVIDTQTRQVIGEPIEVDGTQSEDVAVPPSQPPVASFSAQLFRPRVLGALDGFRSVDPEGQIARYDWSFGDGRVAMNGGPTPRHVYSAPGTYWATLTLTNDEDCSAVPIFTGQTAYCNGSSVASQTQAIRVRFPAVRVKCPAKAKPHTCKIALQAVVSRKRGSKEQSALARVKVKPGASADVSLKPKPRFANRLAAAKRILAKVTRWANGSRVTFVRRFKVVR
jgi:YVTN family beta-propeller protein